MKSNFLFKEIWIKAPIEEVFACFTEEEAMLTWHGKEVTLNAVPGGIYKVIFENGTTIRGIYQEVVPLEKIVYTANYEGVDSVVTVQFVTQEGGTLVQLRQEFSPDQDIASFDYGWDYFLGILQRLVAADPDPR